MSGGSVSGALKVAIFDEMHDASAATLLLDCCGSRTWVRRMVERRPFGTVARACQLADEIWSTLQRDDWLEAFRAHPRIGTDRTAGQSAASARMSAGEQAGFASSGPLARAEIAKLNEEYEQRFGHIFIICASGLSAAEIEGQLRSRMTNAPEHELRVAAEEQRKITSLRLRRALED